MKVLRCNHVRDACYTHQTNSISNKANVNKGQSHLALGGIAANMLFGGGKGIGDFL